MISFGQQLRAYRRQCSDPQRGGLLTQERFGELIGGALSDAGYSGAAVSDWERDKSKIHADDRAVLVALLSVLQECGGISEIEEANGLLIAGNYRHLDQQEMSVVFPDRGYVAKSVGAEFAMPASQPALPVSPGERDRTQQILMDKVESFWVEGVLKKSIAGAPVLALSQIIVEEAVDNPWQLSLGRELIAAENAGTSDILTIFIRSDRALLILGAPGSGKTTTLIALAGSLLQAATLDPTAQLPVILDLSSWAKERRDLASWIVEELTAKYQIPRRYGRRWQERDELILLLDGFDVLPLNARVQCVKAVNQFRETNGLTGLAICSRSQEYRHGGHKFRLNQAVEIQPLTEEQIDAYLTGADTYALRQEMDKDAAVRRLAQSPLMLNVLVTVAENGALDEAIDAHHPLSAQVGYKYLFDAYTWRMFRRRPSLAPYKPRQTLRWLSWLAGRLEEHSLSIFLIEGIQPSWLPSKRWRWIYMLLSGLILGLSGGLIMWLLWRSLRLTLPQLPAAVSTRIAALFNLAQEPVEFLTILLGNLALGLLVGIILGFFFERRRQKPIAAASIKRQRWIQVWCIGLAVAFVTSLFVSLFTNWLLSIAWGIAEGFMYMSAARFIFGWTYETDVRTVEALGWSWQRSLTGAGVGLILALVSELIEFQLYGYNGAFRTLLTLLLAGFILGGLSGSVTTAKSQPNQGVWLSLRNAGIGAVVMAVPMTLMTAIIRDPTYALHIGLLSATIAAALFGASVFVKHFLLRGMLRLQHSLPWRYSRFLNHASQLVFLRKVGGGYIFMHRLLQQYFAGLGAGADES